MTDTRFRRPVPERTQPNRGILGAFGQRNWGAPSEYGHPLGPGFDDAVEGGAPLDFLDDQVREASDLIDRHVAETVQDRAGQDDGLLGTLSGLYQGANGGDLTALVATLTRTYADAASKWVDIAGSLVEQLSRTRSQPGPSGDASGLGAAGPVLSIRAACPVEARVEMFRAALALSAQPLGSDDPANAARITDVRVEDGRLRVTVPADQPPGTYYGLLLEDGAGPAGVVTVEVLAEGAF
jgi:hypothetical protein